MKKCFLLFAFLQSFLLYAQEQFRFQPKVNRILFVLDASGSMKERWKGDAKIETAKEILYHLVDSIEQKNDKVEFALRVFGFQSPREQKNCNDSKLLIPFSKNNAARFKEVLTNIQAQGMTPIAYSLQQGTTDFPKDDRALNALILISDGEENCAGNPCAFAQLFIQNRISLRPFIVGIGVQEKMKSQFDCIGQFTNVQEPDEFAKTVGVIISQTLNSTSLQINLLDKNGKPSITNIPFTLYDHKTHKIMYNFIHTLDSKGNPDTLFLDPTGIYDLEIHSTPPVQKDSIELIVGRHNMVGVEMPLGEWQVRCANSYNENDAQVITRMRQKKRIVQVQDLNEKELFISQNYSHEILTTPVIRIDSAFVMPEYLNEKEIASFGTINFTSNLPLYSLSFLQETKNDLQLVYSLHMKEKSEVVKLQPGEYWIVYKPKNSFRSADTKTIKVKVEENRTLFFELK